MTYVHLGGFLSLRDRRFLTPKMALYPYAYPYRDVTRWYEVDKMGATHPVGQCVIRSTKVIGGLWSRRLAPAFIRNAKPRPGTACSRGGLRRLPLPYIPSSSVGADRARLDCL